MSKTSNHHLLDYDDRAALVGCGIGFGTDFMLNGTWNWHKCSWMTFSAESQDCPVCGMAIIVDCNITVIDTPPVGL